MIQEPPSDISGQLPMVSEGDPPWPLSAAWLNFMVRKIEAFSNIQAEPPLKIVKSDAGFRIVVEE